ncbi:MAG: hypothetical protein ACJ8FS_15415 [Sphingomicrobium sp.]
MLIVLAAGCSASPAANQSAASDQAEAPAKPSPPPPLKKWDEFRFGMTFDEAITAAPGIQWDAESFQKCRKEIPVKGCSLSADPERSYRTSLAGMELTPTLDFNEDGRLTDLRMGRIYKAGVTAAQCESMHGRLLDKLTAMFGQRSYKPKGADKAMIVRRSPGGNTYHRSKSVNPIMVAGIEDFRVATDGGEISLLTNFDAGSEYTEPDCFIDIYVDGPKSLRRRPVEHIEVPKGDSGENDADE